jgi:hypothetical protein
MKKIGFIDYFIDEWHANSYPKFISESSCKDEFKVHMAWQEIAPEGKKSLNEWCKEFNVIPALSIQEVVDNCDCIVVLAPSNPEVHERLAEIPLKSGKPVYIDKPFAPDLKTGQKLFAEAQRHGTPMMSASALRFGSDIQKAVNETVNGHKVNFVSTRGGGRSFQEYCIHQIEMLVMLMGTGAKRVMQCGNNFGNAMIVDYADGRRGLVNLMPSQPFQLSAQYGTDKNLAINEMNDFFPLFIEAMLKFFKTGKSVIRKEETLEITALVEVGIKALEAPDKWRNVIH